jgi:hypothetical protein
MFSGSEDSSSTDPHSNYFDAAIINNPVVHTITTAIGGNMFAQTIPIAPPTM